MNGKPLNGITVVEMGATEAEGIAALLLSDWGADVIRLEILENQEDVKNLIKKFRVCDRGKQRLLFRPDVMEDRAWCKDLFLKADAFVTSVPETKLAQWGFGAKVLCDRNPRLVYTSVTGYGVTGPYSQERLYDDGTIQAESGFMSTTGTENGEPVRSGSEFAVFAGGANACIATLMGLIEAERSGCGCINDVSMMDSILFGFENQYSIYLKSGRIPKPMGNHYALSAPVGDYQCKDGKRIMISVATEAQWKNFAEVMNHVEWLRNPDYRNVGARLKNREVLDRDVSKAFMEYESEELLSLLQAGKCIYGKINDFQDVIRHPQSVARGTFIEAVTVWGEKLTVPTNPLVIDGERSAGTVIYGTEMRQQK